MEANILKIDIVLSEQPSPTSVRELRTQLTCECPLLGTAKMEDWMRALRNTFNEWAAEEQFKLELETI